jgi:cytochrome c-type biogenesis protein CcmH/NrfF
MSRAPAVAAAVAVLVLLASPAAAGPEDLANEIAAKVMSPFCPGVTLHDCPSAEAAALVDRIEKWARQGRSEDEILGDLEAEYGVGIRSTPPIGDGGWFAWALPGAGLLIGLVLGGLLLRRWTNRPAEEDPRDEARAGPIARDELDESDRRRLQRELALLRSER